MFNIANPSADAQKFTEGSQLLPEGWLSSAINNCEEKEFTGFTALVISFENGANVMLNFEGPEQWKIDKATQTLSLLIVSAGITGPFTPDRLPELLGRKVDMKNTHKVSKKTNAQGVPYTNNNLVNFAVFGTRTGQATPTQQATAKPATTAPVPPAPAQTAPVPTAQPEAVPPVAVPPTPPAEAPTKLPWE